MSKIELESVTKRYGSVVAANAISAVFEESSLTCLLGPSGCGKTTLLRIIAGLETPDAGRVLFDGEDVTHLSVGRRDIGMVFQYPVVYRGLTIYENLELPLMQGGGGKLSAQERRERIDQLLSILNLTSKANRVVDGLDNESRQKTAVGRAVVRRPKVVIFDEPVTNVAVDAKIEIQRGIKQLSQEIGQTILYVTHDQTEAMTLADKIILLQSGNIVESANPVDVYNNPESAFGGYFLGSPGMNFIDAAVKRMEHDASARVECSVLSEPLWIRAGDSDSWIDDGAVRVGIRPEEIRIVEPATPGAIQGQVKAAALTGGGRWFLDCVTAAGDEFKMLSSADYDLSEPDKENWFLFDKSVVRLYSETGHRVGFETLHQE
ncbi:ABC transporter ATP-binding protein [Salinisphaera sp. LB1]|uniref:ABC transporter ATP-binding protein n=1 Tax=Salinisphaera sp. LB1 TaxID=2183911 RepID=UPI000D705F7C|nr:ABC transporter ATP-binding protein [Salinisphaera sp. LB1]AWN15413.1 Sulfate and thiosulfate import ATP-binding protein CysA [Salinisphaera sp. LB1]